VSDVSLTPRQREVARLLAQDLTYLDIAVRLGISPRTVEHHAAELRRRTQSRTTAAAVSRARVRGLPPRSAN
jgi:DNA-binding CsgD family transcriptional regulator